MIFDDIEECNVTDFGIDKEDFAYAGILALFKERLQPDLEEAARCTRLARGAGTQEDEAQKDDPKRIALFRDGAKLKELIELYEKKIKKNFGELVPADTFKAAKASLAALDKEARQGAVAILWDLLRPHLPLYSFAMLLMVFDSSVGAATWHGISSLLDGVADGSMSLTQLRQTCYQTYAVFILCVFSHLTSWAFTNKCTSRFTSSVRSRVLRGVLRQDTVFFDVYPSGVIRAPPPRHHAPNAPRPAAFPKEPRARRWLSLCAPASALAPSRRGADQQRRDRALFQVLPPPAAPHSLRLHDHLELRGRVLHQAEAPRYHDPPHPRHRPRAALLHQGPLQPPCTPCTAPTPPLHPPCTSPAPPPCASCTCTL